MPQVLGANANDYRDNASLIIFTGKRAILPDYKRTLAERAGVQCIQLRYRDEKRDTIGTEYSVSGFQGVRLSNIEINGVRRATAVWDTNQHTNGPRAEGALQFVPDEMGNGIAWLPDSPFNRTVLAHTLLGNNALWEIVDKSIEKEILALAEDIKKSPEYIEAVRRLEKMRADVAVRKEQMAAKGEVDDRDPVELEVIVLERKVKKLEAEKKRNELAKRLAKIKQEMGLEDAEFEEAPADDAGNDDEQPKPEKKAEKPKAKAKSKSKSKAKAGAKPKASGDLRAKARDQIYAENPELVDAVKSEVLKARGKITGWATSAEYRKNIQPLIDQRAKEMADVNQGTGVMD